ncbi:unnamed protein product [Heligmosomoides polygyrus]|uniref:Condensin complex subunit 1 C-terminal domain-containing protein n=1 Tax=Heligmosomoides polygyrus TaxID=6339 RepID=A0A3P8CD09_HELPZ|nr:unnamed protein product [Heligmosomoides polygyrus]
MLLRARSSFRVSKDSITLETARNVIQAFDIAVEDGDYEVIYNYFDDLFNICRIESPIKDWEVRLNAADALINAFKVFKPDLVNTLCHAVGAGDDLPDKLAEMCADRVEVLQMLVYLIQRLTFNIEGTVIKRAYSDLGIETTSPGGIDVDLDSSDHFGSNFNSELAKWSELRMKIIEMIGFICCINIPRGNGESVENAISYLWRPVDANTQLLRTLASIIVKFAAHPRFANSSSSSELQKLFAHLRPICVDFKLASEVARIIVKASMNFEYLKDPRVSDYPFVDPIRKLSIEGDMDQMVSHMLYFAGTLRPREASAQSVPKPLALLVEKVAKRAPGTFFENIRGVLPLLEYDPPSMRCAILAAFSHVICGPDMIPRYLRAGRDARIVRDIMTDQLQAHLEDSNIHVRVQALTSWTSIASERRVPFDSLRKGLFFAAAERLSDKAAIVRKAAWQFLVIAILYNPYSRNLDAEGLSETCRKLNEFKERIEQIDPDRPGFFVVMDRFKSFEPKMRRKLEYILENKIYEKGSEDVEEEAFEKVIALLVDMIEISMRDALCVLVKLVYLGKFKNIDVDQPRKDLIEAVIREFERFYVSIHISRIGDAFGQKLLDEMESNYEQTMDLVEQALYVTQGKLLFAEQMTLLYPVIVSSVKQSGFVDASSAVTFFATAERFHLRGAACGFYDLYKMGNPTLSSEVLISVLKLHIKRDSKAGDAVDIVETAKTLMVKLTKPDMKDRHACFELLYHMFRYYNIPHGLVTHLVKIIDDDQPAFAKYPAMAVLALLARVDPRGMREYLRDFQRCLRCPEVLTACEAVHAMSYLIPSNERTRDDEDEAFVYRLRAIDSLFPDIENFLFRVMLSEDDTVESKYWYVSMRYCVKAIFALSCDINYIASRILGKVLEQALVYIDNVFPRLMKRVMELDEAASEQLPEAMEPYADYNKLHSDVEMDFAYREGLFARNVFSVSKTKPEAGDAAASDSPSEVSTRTERTPEGVEDDEDNSNRPSSEELIRTRTQALLHNRLLQKNGVIGQCFALVVFFVRSPGIPDEIRNAALRAFSKFLLISPQITEMASPTFFTFLCSHPDPQMKEYMLAASVDVMHRFPSMLDTYSHFLFEIPMDADPNVRITALLYLSYLLTHDVLKPRGTLSDTALCMLNRKKTDGEGACTNDEREVTALATALFREISRKVSFLKLLGWVETAVARSKNCRYLLH